MHANWPRANSILWSDYNSDAISHHYRCSTLFWYPSSQRIRSEQDYNSLCLDLCYTGGLVHKNHNQLSADSNWIHLQWSRHRNSTAFKTTINSANFSISICQWIRHCLFHKSLFKFGGHLQTVRRFHINYCIHLTVFHNYTFHRQEKVTFSP